MVSSAMMDLHFCKNLDLFEDQYYFVLDRVFPE